MAGQALEAVNEVGSGDDNQQANLSKAVFNERVDEYPSNSITTAELNSDTELSFDNPYGSDDLESSNLIKTAETMPNQENGLEKIAQANPGASEGDSKGPLGWMIDNPNNPIELEIDKAWREPYDKITEMGGHKKLEQYDSAVASIPHKWNEVPDNVRPELVKIAQRNTDHRKPISKADQEQLSKYPGIQKLVQDFRDFGADPEFNKAFELRRQVIDNLEPAIDYRKQASKWIQEQAGGGKRMEDGRSATGASLALILESKSLERYKLGRRY